jgi:hypothetical protein
MSRQANLRFLPKVVTILAFYALSLINFGYSKRSSADDVRSEKLTAKTGRLP